MIDLLVSGGKGLIRSIPTFIDYRSAKGFTSGGILSASRHAEAVKIGERVFDDPPCGLSSNSTSSAICHKGRRHLEEKSRSCAAGRSRRTPGRTRPGQPGNRPAARCLRTSSADFRRLPRSHPDHPAFLRNFRTGRMAENTARNRLQVGRKACKLLEMPGFLG